MDESYTGDVMQVEESKKELSIEEIKSINNETLKYIRSVCDDNNINYYLAHGTVLGAIRHGGFIPWDDDIDLYMFRNEYNKFVTVMKKQTQTNYRLLSIETEAKYTLPLPKVIDVRTVLHQIRQVESMPLGVYIDIFVLDNVPDSESVKKHLYKRLNFYNKCWSFLQYKQNFNRFRLKAIVGKLLYSIGRFCIGPRFMAIRLNKLAQRFKGKETTRVGALLFTSYERNKETFDKSIFGDARSLVFENELYSAPQNAEEYLAQMYGDYMKLPPEEERTTHHHYIAYRK